MPTAAQLMVWLGEAVIICPVTLLCVLGIPSLLSRRLPETTINRFLQSAMIIGLAASTERGTDGVRRDNYQGQLETTLRMFRYDHPKTDVTAGLTVLPSLSESGRGRGEASLKAKWELVNDLFFQLMVYDSYDNKPAENSTTNDWGLVTSLGYTF